MKKISLSGLCLAFSCAVPIVRIAAFEPKIVSGGANRCGTPCLLWLWCWFLCFVLTLIGLFKNLWGKRFQLFWGRGNWQDRYWWQAAMPRLPLWYRRQQQGWDSAINDQPLLNLVLRIDNNYDPEYEVSFDTIMPRKQWRNFSRERSLPSKWTEPTKTMWCLMPVTQTMTGSGQKPTYGGKAGQPGPSEGGANGIDGILNL